MRNFKKFLALVLAMLMVSACVVSVSAASFADQDAIVAAKVNEAVNALTDLGVIKGREDGKFYPNDTLTREEACVIFAKLRAGSEGQKYEWLEETTIFPDVTAKWSFAYINYAFRNGFMTGDGTNFNPKGTLTIEQALCAAVKAYKGNGTKDDPSGIARYASRVEAVGEHVYWAGHYTDIAAELGLTENVPFNFTAPCSRATMAQIAYNLLREDASVSKGFGLEDLTGELVVVSADTATIEHYDWVWVWNEELEKYEEEYQLVRTAVVRSVFEEALADNGFEGALTDYIGAEFTVKYDSVNKTVYSAALKSGMLVFDFNDVLLKINQKDDKNLNTITLAGKTYRVNELGDNGGSGLIGGAGAYPEIAVSYIDSHIAGEDSTVYLPVEATKVEEDGTVTGLKILNNLPEYYKAFAYDDDTDGEYERLVIKKYTLATIKANTKDAKDGVAFDTVTFFKTFVEEVDGEEVTKNVTFTNYDKKENKAKIEYTGEFDAVIDEYTPNLINISYNAGTNSYVVDVLEVAAKKTGLVSGIVTGKSIKIGGETIAFTGEFVKPDGTTLDQNVTVFTIAGKFVKVASSDTSATRTLMVESVKINADGNAVVTGYDVNNRFAKEDLTVVGIAGSKLVNYGAFRYDDKELSDGTKQAQLVYIASKKDATTKYNIEDGKYYEFTITDKGAYMTATAKNDIDTIFSAEKNDTFDTYNKLSVGDYVKYIPETGSTAVAMYKVSSPAVVKIMNDNDAGKKNVYDQTKYSISNSLSETQTVDAAFVTNSKNEVTVVVISAASIMGDVIIANPLAEGETLVQIIKPAHEVGFDADTYKAVDLLNGTVVDVTGVDAVVGNYYVADANYKLGANLDGKWVFDTAETYKFQFNTDDDADLEINKSIKNISEITVTYGGSILPTVTAYATQLKKDLSHKDEWMVPEQVKVNDGQATFSTIDQIKVYIGADATIDGETYTNVITLKDGAPVTKKAADVLEVNALDGKVIKASTNYENADGKTVTFKSVDTYVVGSTMILVMDIVTE